MTIGQITEEMLLTAIAKAMGKTDFKYISRGFAGGPPLPQELWNPICRLGDCAEMESFLEISIDWYQRFQFVQAKKGAISHTVSYAPLGEGTGNRNEARMAASSMVAYQIGIGLP